MDLKVSLLFHKIGLTLNNVWLDRSVSISIRYYEIQRNSFAWYSSSGAEIWELLQIGTLGHQSQFKMFAHKPIHRFGVDATIFLIVALHLGCFWTWFETVYWERPKYQALKSDVSYVESWNLYFLIYFCFPWFSCIPPQLLSCVFCCNEAWRFHGVLG